MMTMFHILLVCCSFGLTAAGIFSDSTRIVEIQNPGTDKEVCFIHTDREFIRKLISEKKNVIIVGEGELDTKIKSCHAPIKDHKTGRRKKRALIYPGTQWCGAGNRASGYNDLGTKIETDKCCRTHDHCKTRVNSFKRKYGIFNVNIWSVNSCECDDIFYNCLKTTATDTATAVGRIFYNVLKIKCIYPTGKQIETCIKKGWWGKCKQKTTQPEYKLKENKKF